MHRLSTTSATVWGEEAGRWVQIFTFTYQRPKRIKLFQFEFGSVRLNFQNVSSGSVRLSFQNLGSDRHEPLKFGSGQQK